MVRTGSAVALLGQLALLAGLAATTGLGLAGWLVGLACGLTVNTLLDRGLLRAGVGQLGAANRVTLTRATIVGGVAALVADSFARSTPAGAMVALATVALVLDAVDGWVARRTGTTSAVGARFDMEVDAFLIFVLSLYVAGLFGPWVLAIGVARYLFVIAGWLLPWLREPTPPRYWCKVVAAIAGIALTVAASGVLPHFVAVVMLVVTVLLLAESFGRDVWWLAHRSGHSRFRRRAWAARATTVVAFIVVWSALVAPNRLDRLHFTAFARIPLEGLVIIGLALVLPVRARQIGAAITGALLGLLVMVKLLDMGFLEALDRPFNPVADWGYFGPAVSLLQDSVGAGWATAAVIAVATLVVLILGCVTFSIMRLTGVTARHRRVSLRAVVALALVWLVGWVFSIQAGSGEPFASTSASALAFDQVHDLRAELHDRAVFAAKIGSPDPFADIASSNLLTGLRGKDVIFAFVESYGRVAVQDSAFSPQVDAVLNAGTTALASAGFASRSAFLTSPTFGGISWLAHSTFQSGLWVDGQQRYDQLLASNRFTLSDAFNKAGWRTVGDVPSNTKNWPEGKAFYNYDQVYDSRNVGYAGPKFSYETMPDQYILSALQRLELSKAGHAPVMAEVDLVSSHTPWAPLPTMVDPAQVGDGSIYDGMPEKGQSPQEVWRDPDQIKTAYGQSIQYSINSLMSFVQNLHDDNLVLVLLGDHQPSTRVSGQGASHDVPITIVAHDPAVMNQIASWGWQDGMLPSPTAPVWPMDSFRDRFLTSFGPPPLALSAPR
jgi:phosphatidylglycerophosphate synthase